MTQVCNKKSAEKQGVCVLAGALHRFFFIAVRLRLMELITEVFMGLNKVA